VSQAPSGSTVEHAWQPPRPRSQDASTGRETRLEPDWSHDEPSVEDEEPSDRFTTVEEEHRHRDQSLPPPPPEDAGSWIKLAVGVVVAIVIALAGWWASRPATADDLFARIEAAANDAQALIDTESDIGLFLERFPDDPRREQVRQWQGDAELERFSRRMNRELRRPSGPGHLSPAELALLDALRHEHSDPDLAAQQLAALIDVFSHLSDDDATVTAQCVKMAQRKLQTLRRVIRDDQQQRRQLIDEGIQWARQTMARDPRAARQVLEGLITLYGDDPSAAPEIERARKLLSEMSP
jgi:hypothetical protein